MAEHDQYQNILNDTNDRERDLGNQLRDSRNQNLRLQHLLDESQTRAERITQMHTDALNNEMEARMEYWQLAQDRQAELVDTQRERDKHRRTAHRLTVRYNDDTERWRRRHAGCVRQAQNWKGQYRNSQNQVQNQNQNIFILQQQILVLQNNPPQNMAAIEHVMQTLAPHLASLLDYDGQESPDTYYIKLRNIN